jgi:hypothetical protein
MVIGKIKAIGSLIGRGGKHDSIPTDIDETSQISAQRVTTNIAV